MKRVLSLALVYGLITAPAAFAEVSDADFEQLRQQLMAVSARLEQLAGENAELKRSQVQTTNDVAEVRTSVASVKDLNVAANSDSWSDRIKLDGDFRYRYERIDVDDSDTRRRNRIRARANIKAEVMDNVDVVFGLATGGDDPVSTNQTLGGGGSSKNIALNLAYVDWAAIDGIHVYAGKYKNPLYVAGKQQLLWDSDWNPEGFAASYEHDWFFANVIGTWLESDSKTNNDNFSWGGQFGVQTEIAGAKITGGLAYFSIKTKGNRTPFGDPASPGDYFGNTAVDADGLACSTVSGSSCTYLYDYLLTEAFAEAAFEVGGWPTVVFADYVKNSDPTERNTAWAAGARVGQAKDRGDFEFSYYYADKEADAVLGLVTDSDFAGGGTDNRGHALNVAYGVSKSWSIGAQYFINEIDVSSGNRKDYNRLMLDTQWKWK